MNKEDEQFIKNVRTKIVRLQNERIKEEKIAEYKKSNFKKEIRLVLSLFLIFCIFMIPVIIKVKIDSIFILIVGSCIIALSCYYENYLKEI